MRSDEQTEMERTGGVFLTFCIVAGIAGLSFWVLLLPHLALPRWLGILLTAATAILAGGLAASSRTIRALVLGAFQAVWSASWFS